MSNASAVNDNRQWSVIATMKFWKALGGVLGFLGCLIALIGLMATAVPLIENEQIQKIVASFAVQGTDRFLNMINSAVLYSMSNSYAVFGTGAALLLLGGMMRAFATRALLRKQEIYPRVRSTPPVAEQQPQQPAAAVQPIPKAPAPMSPYVAAEYGKALSGKTPDGIPSELSRKYMPQSIISVDDSVGKLETKAVPSIVQPTDTRMDQQPNIVQFPAKRMVLETSTVCQACGVSNAAGTNFCSQCGSKLSAQTALPMGKPVASVASTGASFALSDNGLQHKVTQQPYGSNQTWIKREMPAAQFGVAAGEASASNNTEAIPVTVRTQVERLAFDPVVRPSQLETPKPVQEAHSEAVVPIWGDTREGSSNVAVTQSAPSDVSLHVKQLADTGSADSIEAIRRKKVMAATTASSPVVNPQRIVSTIAGIEAVVPEAEPPKQIVVQSKQPEVATPEVSAVPDANKPKQAKRPRIVSTMGKRS